MRLIFSPLAYTYLMATLLFSLLKQIGDELNNNKESEDSDQKGSAIKDKCKN